MGFLSHFAKLRLEAIRRIAARETTVTKMALAIGVQQSTISNYLKGRIQLVPENQDKLLKFFQLTTAMLEDPPPARRPSRAEPIPLIKHRVAIHAPLIGVDVLKPDCGINTAAFPDEPSRASALRARWTRYVAVHATAAQAEFLSAHLRPGSTVVIDRHFQEVVLLTKNGPRVIYAVSRGDFLMFGYLQRAGKDLTLKSDSRAIPDVLIVPGPDQTIVGRVCSTALHHPAR